MSYLVNMNNTTSLIQGSKLFQDEMKLVNDSNSIEQIYDAVLYDAAYLLMNGMVKIEETIANDYDNLCKNAVSIFSIQPDRVGEYMDLLYYVAKDLFATFNAHGIPEFKVDTQENFVNIMVKKGILIMDVYQEPSLPEKIFTLGAVGTKQITTMSIERGVINEDLKIPYKQIDAMSTPTEKAFASSILDKINSSVGRGLVQNFGYMDVSSYTDAVNRNLGPNTLGTLEEL